MDLTGHVHLLLGSPGQPAPILPPSPWCLWVVSAHGVTDPVTAAAGARLSPMAHRAEKALVAAVAADDVDALGRLATAPGGVQDAARVLYAGRLVRIDAALATEVLIAALATPGDPAASKVLHRHWPGLHTAVALAPAVPALAPVGRIGLGLLLAEVAAAQGRPADAVAVLRQLPPQPAVTLALAATLLTMGEHAQVLDLTTSVANVDDISVLALVARSVAARAVDDGPAALDAASAALAVPERAPAVVLAALEERAQVYAGAGADAAARADLEAHAALAQGTHPVAIPDPTPIAARDTGAGASDHDLDRARDRMRRRITGVGEPGTFGGRHHSTYRDEIAEMFALGQLDAAEELLLGLLDAVEDEVAEAGAAFDPTFFLTLADLYQDSGRTDDLVALRERFEAARTRAAAGGSAPPPAGEGRATPAPFDGPPPGDPDQVSIDGRPVDMGAAVEHLLVSVGVAPPQEDPPVETAQDVAPGGEVEPADDADEPTAARPLTPVERAVRGPRVRSL